MKKWLLSIFTIFVSQIYAQNITVREATSLREKNPEEVEAFLSNLNWKLIKKSKPSSDSSGILHFQYFENPTEILSEINLKYFYSEDLKEKVVIMLIKDNSQIEKIIRKVDKLKSCKKIACYMKPFEFIKLLSSETDLYFIEYIENNPVKLSIFKNTIDNITLLDNTVKKNDYRVKVYY